MSHSFCLQIRRENFIVKSIRSVSQKIKFYRRAVSKIFHTQSVTNVACSIHFTGSMNWKYVLLVCVKQAYLGNILQKNMQDGNLCDLQYCWDCNISVVFPTLWLNATKIIDYIEKCFKRKLRQIKFPAKNSVEADFYLPPPRSGAMGRQTFAMF